MGTNSSTRTRPTAVTAVKVGRPRNWTLIITGTVAVLLVLGIVGYAAKGEYDAHLSWQQKADGINGLTDYRKTDPTLVQTRSHTDAVVTYKQSPPVAGNHNWAWERCAGDVYPAQIPNENAVHALEHGAVWITYNPAMLSKEQVAQLAAKVTGNDYMLMSPYPGLKTAVSLQAWGFQLYVNSVTDGRIDKFIQDLRINASMEPGTPCSSGTYVTVSGTTTPSDPWSAQHPASGNGMVGGTTTPSGGASTAPSAPTSPAPSASSS